jgi:hypothetical protein
MQTTIKVLSFLFMLAGLSTSAFPQQSDSLLFKDSSAVSDSNVIKDFTNVKVNRDSISAQDSLTLMKKKFDQFKYGDVAAIANKLLLKKAPFTTKEILNIYKLKGISHYSLSEDDAAKKSFIEILRVDTSFTLDSSKISPKIISFFKQVKQDYLKQQKEIEARTVVRIDTVYIPKISYDIEHETRLREAIARSLLLPGLGHLYMDRYFKGTVFTILSSVSLISSIYYLVNTEQKERAYLVETDPNKTESKYNEYNNSYKYRNISLISFGIIWIYSQIDLLFISDDKTPSKSVNKFSSINYDNFRGLIFNLKYSF